MSTECKLLSKHVHSNVKYPSLDIILITFLMWQIFQNIIFLKALDFETFVIVHVWFFPESIPKETSHQKENAHIVATWVISEFLLS